MAVLVTLLAVVLALVVVLVAGLLRSHAMILRSLHDLGVDIDPDATPRRAGVTVPRPRSVARAAADIRGTSPQGDAVSIAVVGVERATLLAFITSGCTTCLDFWNAFADGQAASAPGGARVVIVTKGPEAESPGRLGKFAPRDVPIVMSSDAWEAYDVPVAPYFAYVDGLAGEVVGEGAAATWGQLVQMMEQALVDAGIDARPARQRRRAGGPARSARVDRALLSAGIEPGDPSLYPSTDADLRTD